MKPISESHDRIDNKVISLLIVPIDIVEMLEYPISPCTVRWVILAFRSLPVTILIELVLKVRSYTLRLLSDAASIPNAVQI